MEKDFRLDVPIAKVIDCVNRLYDNGWEMLPWHNFLYSNLTLVGGRLIGVYQADTTNLLGIAYKDTKPTQAADDDVDSGDRIYNVTDRFDWQTIDVWHTLCTNIHEPLEIVCKPMEVKLLRSTVEEYGGVRHCLKLYVTKPDDNGVVRAIASEDGVNYIFAYVNEDSVDYVKREFNQYHYNLDKIDRYVYKRVVDEKYGGTAPLTYEKQLRLLDEEYERQIKIILE